MGRKKYPEEDKVQSLEKQVRELKSINRHLTKKVKRSGQEIKDPIDPYEEKEPVKDYGFEEKCTHCGKGIVTEIKVANRKFKSCDTCGWRSKAIKC